MFGKKKSKLSDTEIRKLAWEEFKTVMTPKILEEYKNPGTYPTKINVQRTGEGFFVQVGKTTVDATNFINSIICHRCQIINIAAKADKHLLDQYIVTYWYIDGDINTFNQIYNKLKEENN